MGTLENKIGQASLSLDWIMGFTLFASQIRGENYCLIALFVFGFWSAKLAGRSRCVRACFLYASIVAQEGDGFVEKSLLRVGVALR